MTQKSNDFYSAKDRFLQYLEIKRITQYEFSKLTGLSNGFLKSGKSISSENLKLLSNIFNDINLMWIITGEGDMQLSPTTKPNNQAHSSDLLSPSLSPKEKDDYDPSDPKWNANFSAIDIDKTNNQPHQACQACIEKDNMIVALWELIKAKGDTIKTKDDVIAAKDAIIAAKDETIRSKDEQIDELFEKRDDDFDLADTPVSSAS